MEYPNEVKITNFNMHANFYRNARRPEVDKIFSKAESLANRARHEQGSAKERLSNEAKVTNMEARQLWRKIVTHANTL